MRCLHCNHDNPLEARFCGNCGSPLAAPAPTAYDVRALEDARDLGTKVVAIIQQTKMMVG